MRVRRALLLTLLAMSSGCASAAVDYPSLRNAAEARAYAPAGRQAPASRDVNALLARPLVADSAAQVAVLNNRGLRAKLESLAASRAALTAAGRLPNPTLEGAMRFRDEGDPELEVGALIDLTELALVLPRGGAAATSLEAARLDAIGEILDLSFEARAAFYEYQAAVQLLELRRAAVNALAVSAEFSERLREAGNVTELSLVTAQSAFEEARLSFRRAETALASARERVNAILGLWGEGTAWQAIPELPEIPEREVATESLEAEAVRRSLDLEIAKHRISAAAKQANVARAAGWLPELKAGVSAERDERWSLGPAVELELPLFYQGQGELDAARSTMREQQELFTDTAVRVRAAAREVATRLRSSRGAAVYYRDVLLPLKQKVVDQTQLQYNAMSVGVFQLLEAKREQIETAAGYIDQLRDYWLARTRAEQLLSGRLGEGSWPPATAASGSAPSSGASAAGAH